MPNRYLLSQNKIWHTYKRKIVSDKLFKREHMSYIHGKKKSPSSLCNTYILMEHFIHVASYFLKNDQQTLGGLR